MKSDLEALFDALGVPERRYERLIHPSFHTGRSARIYVGESEIGVLGEASYDVSRAYNLKKRTMIAEVRMEELLVLSREWKKYEPISRFPMMERDIALVVERTMTHGEIADVIRKAAGENLESVHLFDVFTGGIYPLRRKAWRTTLSSAEKIAPLRMKRSTRRCNPFSTLFGRSARNLESRKRWSKKTKLKS